MNHRTEMGKKSIVILNVALGCLLLSIPLAVLSCSSVKGAGQRFMRSLRYPGEKQLISVEDTVKRYDCSSDKKKGKLIIEDIEVIPNPVSRDEEINQRIVYAFCPGKTPASKGKIVRTVLYKGEQVFQDSASYQFKGGTWILDAFISIPKDAPKGAYVMQLLVAHDGKPFRKDIKFEVTR